MPAALEAHEPTPAPQGRATLFPTRAAVEHVLSDLLAVLRRRATRPTAQEAREERA
jgi:hypothetical protein